MEGRSGCSVPTLSELLRALQRSASEMLAFDYYAIGKFGRSVQLLRSAQKLHGRDEETAVLQHNLVVASAQSGSQSTTERTLERLGNHPPEALLNLGILYD